MSSNPIPSPERPLFSVVVASYNFGHFVTETLDSVLAQDFHDFELVVVDDGSTDNTREVLEPYLDRIRYVYQENRGLAGAWNTGIRESCGRIIGFLGADDHWEPHTLSGVLEAFRANPDVGFVAISAREMNESGRLSEHIITKNTPGDFYSTVSLLWGDSGSASFYFIRREVQDQVGWFDEALRSAEDIDMLLRLSFETKMMNLREPLIRHREHAASLSHDLRTNARYWLQILDRLEKAQPGFAEEHPWVIRRARGKELLRLGRETLSLGEPQSETWREARRLLLASIREFPFFSRTYLYLAWSVVAPSTFRSWRRREMIRRSVRRG